MKVLTLFLVGSCLACTPTPTTLADTASLQDSLAFGDTQGSSVTDEGTDTLHTLPHDALQDVDSGNSDSLAEIDATTGFDAFADIESHFRLTYSGTILMDANFKGYTANLYGAQVYGPMLKIWVSDGDSRMEVLVRLDEVSLPGTMTPVSPGGAAWALFFFYDTDAYISYKSPNALTINTCPTTPGMMINGTIENMLLISLDGQNSNLKVSAEFNVLLGEVIGEVPCANQ
jgi:hypothetical protein